MNASGGMLKEVESSVSVHFTDFNDRIGVFGETVAPVRLGAIREPLHNPFFEPLLRATGEMHSLGGSAGARLSPWRAFPRDQGALLPLRPIRRPCVTREPL